MHFLILIGGAATTTLAAALSPRVPHIPCGHGEGCGRYADVFVCLPESPVCRSLATCPGLCLPPSPTYSACDDDGADGEDGSCAAACVSDIRPAADGTTTNTGSICIDETATGCDTAWSSCGGIGMLCFPDPTGVASVGLCLHPHPMV